jgi:hypothetical protein
MPRPAGTSIRYQPSPEVVKSRNELNELLVEIAARPGVRDAKAQTASTSPKDELTQLLAEIAAAPKAQPVTEKVTLAASGR